MRRSRAPLPSAQGLLGKGVAFPFWTHPPARPPRSGARNSALAEPHAPGYSRGRRTRAERDSVERFLGRLRSSGCPPRGRPRVTQETGAAGAAPSAQLLGAAESGCGRPRSLRRVPGLDARARGEWDSLFHWFVAQYHSETGGVEWDIGEEVCLLLSPAMRFS